LKQQIKLLRVIEEKVFEHVGGAASVEADIRIIASSKESLLSKIQEGTFRSDLYYRLNVLRINLPPLREHMEDVPLLVENILRKITQGSDYYPDPDAMRLLKSHSWPGNVRELGNTLERAFLTGNGVVSADTIGTFQTPAPVKGIFRDAIQQTEYELLQEALQKTDGNKSAAARLLGMKLSTLRDKLSKHGL
jgi:DNA-binding NtrC family response regulator